MMPCAVEQKKEAQKKHATGKDFVGYCSAAVDRYHQSTVSGKQGIDRSARRRSLGREIPNKSIAARCTQTEALDRGPAPYITQILWLKNNRGSPSRAAAKLSVIQHTSVAPGSILPSQMLCAL